MPDKNKNNWFTRATLEAMMADAPAVAISSGWTNDPKAGVQMGDRDAEGNAELRESLSQIASIPLSELSMGLLSEALPAVIRIRNPKNFVRSRKIMRDIHKAEQAGDWNAPYFKPGKNDIQELSYFMSDNIGKTGQIGRYGKIQSPGMPKVTRYPNAQSAREAVEYARSAEANEKLSVKDIMKQIATDKKSLKSGDKVSLITDGALSKDSYPLYIKTLLKNIDEGSIRAIKDKNAYRMIRLNKFGVNPKSIKRVDRTIEDVRKALNDPNIPGRTTLFGKHYVPAFEYVKYNNGGLLNQFQKTYIDTEDLLNAIKSVKTGRNR